MFMAQSYEMLGQSTSVARFINISLAISKCDGSLLQFPSIAHYGAVQVQLNRT